MCVYGCVWGGGGVVPPPPQSKLIRYNCKKWWLDYQSMLLQMRDLKALAVLPYMVKSVDYSCIYLHRIWQEIIMPKMEMVLIHNSYESSINTNATTGQFHNILFTTRRQYWDIPSIFLQVSALSMSKYIHV